MKKIIIHLVIIGLVSFVMVVGVLAFLDSYTNQNTELILLDDLQNKNVGDALTILEKCGLEGVVTDTVYKDGAKKLAVINQNPPAGLKVKPGRKVYLVVNTDKMPMVKVPDLAMKTSLPQAISILLRTHLKVGVITKKVSPSVRTMNDEPVLAQYKSGTTTTIVPGTKIPRNSSIDLVIGISSDHYANDSTQNLLGTE